MEEYIPQAKMFTKLVLRLVSKVPELRYVDADLGQLDHYDIRPSVSWPCCLIDLDEFKFFETGNKLRQIGDGFISLRIGMVRYGESNNLVADNVRLNALRFYSIENKINQVLHGWEDEGFSRLLRRFAGTERRTDDIRVRIIKYAVSYNDNVTPANIKVPRPEAKVLPGTNLQ
jgi:hypothetical protein